MSLKLWDFFWNFLDFSEYLNFSFVITIPMETILSLFISGFSNVFLKVHIILRRPQKYDKIYQTFDTISNEIWRFRQILVTISEYNYMNFEMKQFDNFSDQNLNICFAYIFSAWNGHRQEPGGPRCKHRKWESGYIRKRKISFKGDFKWNNLTSFLF